jgi:hypothetical protein
VSRDRKQSLVAQIESDSLGYNCTMNSTGSTAAWVVYDYEVDMFKQTWSMVSMGVTNNFRHPIPNAIVESMLLHLRILTEILISKGTPDDIKLSDLLPKFESRLVDEMRIKYGASNAAGSPCWTLNKMLAHPSSLRADHHNYDSVLSTMMPHILPLLDEIVEGRRLLGVSI